VCVWAKDICIEKTIHCADFYPRMAIVIKTTSQCLKSCTECVNSDIGERKQSNSPPIYT